MSDHPVLPYGRQWISEDDCEAVLEVLRSDYLTTGPWVERFEADLCATTGAGAAVVMNSGTSALHGMYAAMGIGPGRTVLTSPLTFAATANAALYLGARVLFADIDPVTGNLDPRRVAERIEETPVDLVVPVDYAGHPADYDALTAVLAPKGIPMVADAAHSLGARYKGRPVGTLAEMTEISLHPVKPITTAEGGAVLGHSSEALALVREFRSHGITRDPSAMNEWDGPWSYDMTALGYNYRMTDLQCALGSSQIRRLEAFLTRRRQIAARYQEGLKDLSGLRLPVALEDVTPGWHLYVVRVRDASRRRAFFEALRAAGLGVQVHYRPVYLHSHYRSLGFTPGLCPEAEAFYAGAVSLPMYPAMTDADVDRVIGEVTRVTREMGL